MRNNPRHERGAALISTLFFLIIVTVMATGAILLSTLQMKVAGSIARWEGALSATEGSVNYVIPLIQNIHFDNIIPPQFVSAVTSSANLVTELTTVLNDPDQEIDQMGPPFVAAAPDVLLPAADTAHSIGGYDVAIDIDAVGSTVMAGGAIESAWAYHGAHSRSGVVKGYRVTSTASTPSGGTRARINQIFWLKAGS